MKKILLGIALSLTLCVFKGHTQNIPRTGQLPLIPLSQLKVEEGNQNKVIWVNGEGQVVLTKLPLGAVDVPEGIKDGESIRYNSTSGEWESYTPSATDIGATSVGNNLIKLTDPGAVSFLRVNADNTISALSAADFRTAIGVGTGTGTVTSVSAGSGMNFTTITGTGAVTLGTPGSLTDATTNGVTATSHTHAVTTVLPSNTSSGIMKASGSKTSGGFYGGTTAPTNTTRLNYDGYLYATRFYGDGSGLTSLSASALPSSIDATKIADGTVDNTEFQYLNGVTSSIQTQLNSKQASLGYTAENSANKVTSFSSPTDTQYPSAKLVSDQLGTKMSSSGSFYLGTTSVAVNRSSAAQTLSGVSVSGNAGTATKLETARTINGVSFDGTSNITIEAVPSAHNHSATEITSGTLGVARGGTGIASYTAGNYINASNSTTLQQRTPAQVLSDIGAASSSHSHAFSAITSKPTTLSGYGITDAASSTHTHAMENLSNVTVTSNGSGEILKWNGTAWVNNTLAEAGIQPAGSYLVSADISGKEDTSNKVTSFSSPTDTQYPSAKLVSDQLGTKMSSSGSFYLGTTSVAVNRSSAAQTLSGVSVSGNAGTATKLETARAINGVSFDGTQDITIEAVPSVHNHSATEITSGTLAVARGGTGLASYTAGNYINASNSTTLQQRTPAQVLSDIGAASSTHSHAFSAITSKPTTLSGYGITDAASSSHMHTMENLSNVTVTSNSSGEILKWNGTAWVNNTLAEAGIQPAGSYLISADISGKEDTSNKVTSFSSPTDTQYPSAKLVSDQLGTKMSSSGSFYLGTTSVAVNRSSAAQTLSGVSVSGNAGTATKLETARTINGVSFDGTSNITIEAVPSTHNHSATEITSGTLAVARGGTGLASYTAGNYINASNSTTLQQRTPAQVLSDIGAASSSHSHAFSAITSKPTTLSGYGITDAQSLDGDLTSIAGLAGTSGILKKTAANTWTLDTNSYLSSEVDGSITNEIQNLTYTVSTRVLAIDGTGSTDVTLPVATTTDAGLMSSTDKSKLDGVATGANNYSHPTGDGNLHVPATGTTNSGKVLTAGATAGSLSWETIPSGVTDLGQGTLTSTTVPLTSSSGSGTTLAAATTSVAGVMSAADKTKLNGIATGAEVNVNADWDAVSGDAQILNKPTTFTPAAHNHSATNITSGTLAVARGGTGIASYTAGNYINALNSTTLQQRTPAEVRADIGAGTGDGTVTSITAGSGMNFTTITGSGTVTLGTPGTLTDVTTNGLTATSHTHAVTTVLPSSTSSGIMKASGSKVSGGFYGGTTAPSNTTRLNYDGYLYATQLYDGVNRVYSAGNTNIGAGATNYSAGNHTHTGLLPSIAVADANKVLKVNSGGTAAEWVASTPMTGDISISEAGAVTVTAIQNKSISTAVPSSGQVLKFNGTSWAPALDNGSTYTFTNGLTNSSGTVKLGGTLTGSTTINLGTQQLTFNSVSSSQPIAFEIGASSNFKIFYNETSNAFSLEGNTGNALFHKSVTISEGLRVSGTGIDISAGGLDVNGNSVFTNDLTVNGNFYNPSDKRLKRDVETLSGVMDRINQIRGVHFEFINQEKYATGQQIGVIAQELQQVYPELVATGDDGFLKVNYTQLTAVLLQGMKEQQQQINELKERVNQQEQRLDAQQKQIDEILKTIGR